MAKKLVNYIDAAEFEAIIRESGLTCKAQAGFVKVSGAKGRNVYVARTKRVGRVDLSGFTMDHPGIRTLDEDERFCSVSQQLDFSRSKDEILDAFKDMLEALIELPAREEPRKKPATPKSLQGIVGWTLPRGEVAQADSAE